MSSKNSMAAYYAAMKASRNAALATQRAAAIAGSGGRGGRPAAAYNPNIHGLQPLPGTGNFPQAYLTGRVANKKPAPAKKEVVTNEDPTNPSGGRRRKTRRSRRKTRRSTRRA